MSVWVVVRPAAGPMAPEPWSLSISDDHKKLVFTAFAYEELRAIKKAVERAGKSDEFVRAIFWDNGISLLAEGLS